MRFHTTDGTPIEMHYVCPDDLDNMDADITTPDGRVLYGAINSHGFGWRAWSSSTSDVKDFKYRQDAIDWIVTDYKENTE